MQNKLNNYSTTRSIETIPESASLDAEAKLEGMESDYTLRSDSSSSVPASLPSRLKKWLARWQSSKILRRFGLANEKASSKWLIPLREPMQELKTGREALSNYAAQVESRFLEIGNLLQTQSELSINLVTEGDKLTSLTLDSDKVQNTDEGHMDHIWHSLQFMAECRDKTQGLLEHLEIRQTQLNAMLQKESFWRQTIAPLRIFQTLFKISSANLQVEMQSVFVTLTDDIGKLYLQVTDTFTSQFQALASTRGSLEALIEHMRVQVRLQTESLVKAHALKKSYEELQVQLRESHSCEMVLSDLLQKNAEEVSRVVVGIQYQDITRQQLEHILKGLDEMTERFEGGAEFTALDEKQALSAYLHHAARLQAGQLQALQSELSEAQKNIGDGVRRIDDGIGKMEDKCHSVWEQRKCGIMVDGTVQIWLDTLQDMRTMLASSVAEMEKTLEFTKLFDGLAANVTTGIQRLAMSIRLIALNAQVQVARVGGDNGLEVLSERTRDLADEISGFSFSIGSEIESVVAGLDEVSKQCVVLKGDGLQRKLELETAAKFQENVLHEYRDKTLFLLGAIDDLFEQSKSHAKRMLESVDFSGISSEFCQSIQDALVQTSRYCADHAGSEGTLAAAARQLEGQKTIYTMGSERDVHASVFAKTEGQQEKPDGTARKTTGIANASTEAGSDLGGNVELF